MLENGEAKAIDLIDAMIAAADDNVSDADVLTMEQNACPTCGSCSGMFTANSMNCLTEALGLALPGNGSTLATHADRERLFVEAGHLIVDLAKRYYEQNDESVLPRNIATFKAFENAMTLDISMGGSTNTVLHLLAASFEGEVGFTISDIDRLSRQVPVLCKVAPSVANIHMEDIHRAGGIFGILGELDRAGLIDTTVPTIHAKSMKEALARWDVKQTNSESVHDFFRAAPGGVPSQVAFSQDRRWDDLDLDREKGVIRSSDNAYSKDGGLAVLFGNIAEDGCIVKTAGVDDSILKFTGPARIFESQDSAVSAVLTGKVKEGDVVLIRYEGPRGGPGMQEMLYPTSYLKSKGLGKACALITDGRFSGGSSGLSIGHISPEAAEGRRHRPGGGRRHHRYRHPEPGDEGGSVRRGSGRAPQGHGSQGRRRLEACRKALPQNHYGAARLCGTDHQCLERGSPGSQVRRPAGLNSIEKAVQTGRLFFSWPRKPLFSRAGIGCRAGRSSGTGPRRSR